MFYENDWDHQNFFNAEREADAEESSPSCHFASFSSSFPSDYNTSSQDFEHGADQQSPFGGYQDDGSPSDDQEQQQQQQQQYYEVEEEDPSSTASSSGWPSFDEPQQYSNEPQQHPFYDEPSYLIDPRTVYIPSAHVPSSRQNSYSGASEEDGDGEYLEGMSDDGGGGGSSEFYGDTERERRERRKATNRASAKAFRLRRKILLKEQQQSLDERDAELTRLREEAELLRYDNDLLRSATPVEDTIYEEEEEQQGHRW